jgi:ribosomal protein S14
MELRTESPRKYVQTRLLNHCAQCGETIFLPEWSEYLDRHRVRHLWECEACGYKFETLVTFPDRSDWLPRTSLCVTSKAPG